MYEGQNPTLSDKNFKNLTQTNGEVMTLESTINNVYWMLGIVFLSGYLTWNMAMTGSMEAAMGLGVVGAIGGLISAMVTIFKKEVAAISAPVYAGFEGLLLGGMSAYMETMFPGIVFQAVCLTFLVLFGMLIMYQKGMLKATEGFRRNLMLGMFAIFGIYIVSFIGGFFGFTIPLIHESGPVGIGFSLVVVAIASMNFILDFDFIERAAKSNLPKYMEWYSAFSLMVTLIWVYVEILRLLSKLRSRD